MKKLLKLVLRKVVLPIVREEIEKAANMQDRRERRRID